MNPIANDILMHYGVSKLDGAPGPGSGRYPRGSGENPYQRANDFLGRISKLKNEGLSETEIAESLGMTTTQLRVQKAIARNEKRAIDVETARRLRDEGLSLNEIAEKMGYSNDSSVRSLLNTESEARMNEAIKTADFLRAQIEEKGMIDVGTGVEKELNISKEKLREALTILEMEGYPIYGVGIPQATNLGKQTNVKVICPIGTEHKDAYNYEDIHSVRNYISHDDGETFDPKWVYPKSMDSSRLQIRYAEEGGVDMDGVIELRRGVDDLSLGNSHYAQVRILVDDTKYIKGMAIYSDDLPDGVDVRFNTNKKLGTPKLDVLKDIKADPDNPFGSLIKSGVVDPDNPSSQEGGQSYYYDKNGNKQLSLINKRAEEGDWGEWSKKLPAQFLSKQNITLVKQQLSLAEADKVAEFEEIKSLTNPTVKQALLNKFADSCDSDAVHLQAAALPRQRYQVILPVESLKDNEVYAPNYKNGEKIALIRYPHGGTFEIPILTVNNKQADAKKILGNALDAVGINSKVAQQLSGADFDGDTVMVIPTGKKVKITATKPLEGLKDFDPKMSYPYISGMKVMKNTQTEMGKISNLITDMTLKGATEDELAKAVRHSMVVIDAEKHKLNYKQSEIDNDISALKKKYQGRVDEDGKYHEGASTLISRAKAEVSVPKRQGSPTVDKETGNYIWKTADNLTYIDKKTGKVRTRTQASTQMAETDDASKLVSSMDNVIEKRYSEYANTMKGLGRQARLEAISTKKTPYSAQAKKVYQEEVKSLDNKLSEALSNAPRERIAQAIANSIIKAKKMAYPDMTKAEIKKTSQQEIVKARAKVGAKRTPVKITSREWEAIQSGAISTNKLTQIMNYADMDTLRQYAMPRASTALSSSKVAKINAMRISGYTTAEIAEAIGVSTSTVQKYISGKEKPSD